MRNFTPVDMPTLFPPDAPMTPVAASSLAVESTEQTPEKLAREFVRWCWGFGKDFRNSPDVTNLRFWMQKTRSKSLDTDEAAILNEARRLFLKRLEQLVAKSDTPSSSEQG